MNQAIAGTRVIEKDGAKIVYDVELPSNNVTSLLLLVNGFQRPRGDFKAFRKRLAKIAPEIATVSLDNRGTGESVLTEENVSIPLMADDCRVIAETVCRELNFKKFNVLGISMGGIISMALAQACTQVDKLILVSTTAGGDGRTNPSWYKDDSPEFVPWPTDEEGMRARMAPYFGAIFLEKAPLLFEMMIKNMLKKAGEADSQRASVLQFNASRAYSAVEFLPKLRNKALIVTGTEDHIIPPANARYLNQSLVNSRLIEYPNVGHLVLIEEAEKFVADVSQFLQNQ